MDFDKYAPRLWISRDILSIPKFIANSMESANGERLASVSDKLCYNNRNTSFMKHRALELHRLWHISSKSQEHMTSCSDRPQYQIAFDFQQYSVQLIECYDWPETAAINNTVLLLLSCFNGTCYMACMKRLHCTYIHYLVHFFTKSVRDSEYNSTAHKTTSAWLRISIFIYNRYGYVEIHRRSQNRRYFYHPLLLLSTSSVTFSLSCPVADPKSGHYQTPSCHSSTADKICLDSL